VLILIFWLVYFACFTITNPYPIEYREGAAQVMTRMLLGGENPFSLENQPLGMNNYGIVYSLFVLPFAALFGNTLSVYRAITLSFILLSFLFIVRTALRINRGIHFAVACGAFAMVSWAGRGGLGAFPFAMGSFLFLTGIMLPFNRSFNYPGLLSSALLCLLAYYTKPYFILSFGIVASYVFVFISKSKGVFYSLFFILLLAFSYLLVRYIFPFYFIDTLISNLSNAELARNPHHVYIQLLEFVREFYPSIILALLIAWMGVVRLITETSFREFFADINFLSFHQPLISKPVNYFAYFLICSSLAFVFVLGAHSGNYMVYMYQMIVPVFFLWLFQYLKPESRIALISMPLLLFNLIFLHKTMLNPSFLEQRNLGEWVRLYQYIDSSSRVLNSPVVVPKMLELGMQPIDSGQTEFFYYIMPYPNNKLLGPNYDVIEKRGDKYKNEIRTLVENTRFDRIILTEEEPTPLVSRILVSQYYFRVASLIVAMPQTSQQWTIDVWEPIRSGDVKGASLGLNPLILR
jgi:hypothetical protein